jgi:hypothetical protein
MRKIFGIVGMFGLLVLTLGPRPSSAYTPEVQACLYCCAETREECEPSCAGDPTCEAQCDTDYFDCRQACFG